MNRQRQSGAMLVELMVALGVLTIGLLGFFSSFSANFSTAEEINHRDGARAALERTVETLRSSNLATLYQNYQYAYLEVPEIPAFKGTYTYVDPYTGVSTTASYSVPAYAYVFFYTNEFTVPSFFGPVTDLDGSGAKDSSNCNATYKLLPAQIFLVYGCGKRIEWRERFLLFGGT